ncbi:tryptophan 2,3-dioxygenase [Photobacterium sp. WH77]|uniref:Tryptophan 2,3-dioxygenase n=1 Tax=Photobacterium arenosum TaxID=2774143 RepID=A0ABR9BNL3_9GAMM|nr:MULTISPECIES: tryptophan 2,3-dioxygenase [Photobacterium]MBD8514077.1 tryptophan 2,3-dioxygenase [Photobacterium arenosum]MBV7264426.1 tryptophan 2,3-dioxygenase [Photobacterium sp. WH24]MCG2837471.1 tryptophan 2,3-dioxygenase [Photobacterium sp. WH77]MCG2844959.1 tryptophan 2,3-dioxygenase [Photobacterium sp. WH80]
MNKMDKNQTAPTLKVDLDNEKVHWDQDMSYGQYLALGPLLSCQHPVTQQHDEMLFVVIHQVSELWMKLCLHEAYGAVENIRKDKLRPAFKMMSRMARIQSQMLNAWEVLATMTPADYASFRDELGQSSGFQSYQYRELEFLLGNKNEAMIQAHRAHPKYYDHLKSVLHAPSIYDITLQLLKARGFDVPESHLNRDFSQPYQASEDIERIWAEIYNNSNEYWDLYELAEKLVDMEFNFQKWRFSHMKTVERIIGYRRGTGGTSGVKYLNKALELQFFPELWSVRTSIEGPKHD